MFLAFLCDDPQLNSVYKIGFKFSSFQVYLTYMHFVLTLLIPSTMLAVVILKLLQLISKNQNIIQEESEQQRERTKLERNFTKCFLQMSALFLVSNLPKFVINTFDLFLSEDFLVSNFVCFICFYLVFSSSSIKGFEESFKMLWRQNDLRKVPSKAKYNNCGSI